MLITLLVVVSRLRISANSDVDDRIDNWTVATGACRLKHPLAKSRRTMELMQTGDRQLTRRMVRTRMVSSLSAVTVEIAGDGGMRDKGCYDRSTLGAIARHAQPLQTSRKAAPSTATAARAAIDTTTEARLGGSPKERLRTKRPRH